MICLSQLIEETLREQLSGTLQKEVLNYEEDSTCPPNSEVAIICLFSIQFIQHFLNTTKD